MTEEKKINNERIDEMFKVGAHFGYSKTRRHASVSPYIFGVKNKVEIIDLEKTDELLEKALSFILACLIKPDMLRAGHSSYEMNCCQM